MSVVTAFLKRQIDRDYEEKEEKFAEQYFDDAEEYVLPRPPPKIIRKSYDVSLCGLQDEEDASGLIEKIRFL